MSVSASAPRGWTWRPRAPFSAGMGRRTALIIAGLLFLAAAVAGGAYAISGPRAHPLSADTLWLAFGWTAQALFTARFLVQWLAAERAGAAVVPPAFWWLSLCGGVTLGIYFLKRHDPVGVVGQMAPVAIYVRNLALHYRKQKVDIGIGVAPARARPGHGEAAPDLDAAQPRGVWTSAAPHADGRCTPR